MERLQQIRSSRLLINPKFKLFLLILLLLLSAVIFFYHLDHAPLQRWDEATNAEVVEEFISNPSLRLQLNGSDFLEKPPLWYYLSGLLSMMIENRLLSIRLLSAVSGFILTGLIFNLVRKKIGFYSGVLSALIFLAIGQQVITFPSGYLFSTHTYRSADLDAFHILLLISALYCAFMYKKAKYTPVLTAVLCAIAFMVKGPLAFPVFFILLIYLSVSRKQKGIAPAILSTGIFAGLISLILLVQVSIYGPNFQEQFINYHIFQRVLLPLEGHNGDAGFYLAVLADTRFFAPGLICLVQLFLTGVFWKKLKPESITLITLISVILLIITIVSTKLAWYILPLYPLIALYMGFTLSPALKLLQKKRPFLLYGYLGLFSVSLCFGIYNNLMFIFS